MDNSILLEGNCLDELKNLDDNSIDSIVTDPPYGLKFMGKKWDYSVPSVEIWREALRVLKPGGHLLSFGGTRTYHRMVVAIEDAGFEIRDQIMWIYGSGFPKSHNIKDGEFKGYGTALKPANEPIVLARKPLEGTVAQNISKWGVGGLNIDESRIGLVNGEKPSGSGNGQKGTVALKGDRNDLIGGSHTPAQGRWPANIIFDEAAAEMLDAQSGVVKSGGNTNRKGGFNKEYVGGDSHHDNKVTTSLDRGSGGASRFFYVAKASKKERNAGLEGMPLKEAPGSKRSTPAEGRTSALGAPRANHHPTVKPIKLMEYLIKLVTPKGGVVLDPFMGSGSTGVAAVGLGYTFIGIEMNSEYLQIAEKRINSIENK